MSGTKGWYSEEGLLERDRIGALAAGAHESAVRVLGPALTAEAIRAVDDNSISFSDFLARLDFPARKAAIVVIARETRWKDAAQPRTWNKRFFDSNSMIRPLAVIRTLYRNRDLPVEENDLVPWFDLFLSLREDLRDHKTRTKDNYREWGIRELNEDGSNRLPHWRYCDWIEKTREAVARTILAMIEVLALAERPLPHPLLRVFAHQIEIETGTALGPDVSQLFDVMADACGDPIAHESLSRRISELWPPERHMQREFVRRVMECGLSISSSLDLYEHLRSLEKTKAPPKWMKEYGAVVSAVDRAAFNEFLADFLRTIVREPSALKAILKGVSPGDPLHDYVEFYNGLRERYPETAGLDEEIAPFNPAFEIVDKMPESVGWEVACYLWGEKLLRGVCVVLADAGVPFDAEDILRHAGRFRAFNPGALNSLAYCFEEIGGRWGVTCLLKLKHRAKHKGLALAIDKCVARLAAEAGMTENELLDQAVPDFGLDSEGVLETHADDYRIRLELVPGGKPAFAVFDDKGKKLKSIPSAVKTRHSETLAGFKEASKEIASHLTIVRDRIELQFREGTRILAGWFKEYYLSHPLVRFLATRLIWQDEQGRSFLGTDGIPDGATQIRLWHPGLDTPEGVARWRRRVMDERILQPIRQAFRELYVLTPAEEETAVYSDRFAGVLVVNSVYHGLRKSRGWGGDYGGFSDGLDHRKSTLIVRPGLRASLQFDLWGDKVDDMGGHIHVVLGRLFFESIEGQSTKLVPLKDIDPIAFSEVMRDVDLFVSVAGVTRDPNWVDRGSGQVTELDFGRHSDDDDARERWSEGADVRSELLREVISVLGLKNVEFTNRHALIHGKRADYRVHLGAGHVHILPGNRYLSLESAKRSLPRNVFVPFEEQDKILNDILSTILLLAKDETLRDRGILGQIEDAKGGGA